MSMGARLSASPAINWVARRFSVVTNSVFMLSDPKVPHREMQLRRYAELDARMLGVIGGIGNRCLRINILEG